MNREDWLSVARCARWRGFEHVPIGGGDPERFSGEQDTEAMARAMAETAYLRAFARILCDYGATRHPDWGVRAAIRTAAELLA